MRARLRTWVSKLRICLPLREMHGRSRDKRLHENTRSGPTRVNCGNAHSANYLGCSYYIHTANMKTKSASIKKSSSNNSQPTVISVLMTSTQALPTQSSQKPDYTSVIKGNSSHLSIDRIITFLTDLIKALTTAKDPKSI